MKKHSSFPVLRAMRGSKGPFIHIQSITNLEKNDREQRRATEDSHESREVDATRDSDSLQKGLVMAYNQK